MTKLHTHVPTSRVFRRNRCCRFNAAETFWMTESERTFHFASAFIWIRVFTHLGKYHIFAQTFHANPIGRVPYSQRASPSQILQWFFIDSGSKRIGIRHKSNHCPTMTMQMTTTSTTKSFFFSPNRKLCSEHMLMSLVCAGKTVHGTLRDDGNGMVMARVVSQ